MSGHAPPSESIASLKSRPQRARLRILLVEDNPGDARLIRELLADARLPGFCCVVETQLDAALQRLARETIDVVLLDLSLPDSQGFETFLKVRECAPDLAIVVLTGLDDEELALKAVREGAQDYLVKGHVDADLLDRVVCYSVERHLVQKELQELNANLERRVEERTQELSKAYDALARANEDLRELDRLKSAFISVTSHELRTPLTAICGMLSILNRMLPANDENLAKCCGPALQAAKRLERLVVRVLEMIEKGEYAHHSKIESAEPGRLVESAVREVAPFVELRKQSLAIEVEDHLPSLCVDKDKIQDSLVNLLMNAIKFTPDEGDIRLRVGRKGIEALEFRVSDTGVGIPEDDRPHVFEEFFTSLKTEHHSSGEYQFEKRGIGLGLAIVKKFVEMHGGEVGLESTPGCGSDFFFTLPLGRQKEADLQSAGGSSTVA